MTDDAQRRLAETVAWCVNRASGADPGATIRTPALRPPILGEWKGYELIARLGNPRVMREAVEFVCEERRRRLEQAGAFVDQVGSDLAGGRVLCTDFETDLCGAAVVPSGGFLDDEDIPGWDTWFSYEDRILSCWVPRALVPFAQAGIDVIPVPCLWWLGRCPSEVSPQAWRPRYWWQFWKRSVGL